MYFGGEGLTRPGQEEASIRVKGCVEDFERLCFDCNNLYADFKLVYRERHPTCSHYLLFEQMNTKLIAFFALLLVAAIASGHEAAILNTNPSDSSLDENWGCAEWKNGVCTRCSYRFIQQGLTCEPVNPLCKTWDNTGKCLTCYPGYSVCAEGCAPDKTLYSDQNCNTFDATGKCTQCSAGAYFKNGVCTQYSANCKTVDQNSGACLSCYVGYNLQADKCALVPLVPNNEKPSDLLCALWKGATCLQCSKNAYFKAGVCTNVNPLCKSFDATNGACTSCYAGYNLANGECAAAPVSIDNSEPVDKLCAEWKNNVCQKCSYGAVFRSGVCVQVSALCKTWDSSSGACTSCYSGYYLDAGKCLLSPSVPDNAQPSDILCSKWKGTTCLQCSTGSYFSNGVCKPANTQCKTFDATNGNCLSCYYGYLLKDGNCSIANTEKPTDVLCAKWVNGACTECARGSYSSNGVCTQADTLCKTFDSNGACTSCYVGYNLQGGKCVEAPSQIDNSKPSDPYCAKWSGKTCLECAKNTYFKNGVCTAVNALCKTFDATSGACTSCYVGYEVSAADCILTTVVIDNSQPADILCAKWSGSTCLQCSKKAYSVNGVCTNSNPLCKTYDSTNGNCLTCYNGYLLQGGSCEVDKSQPADGLCAKWNGAVCVECNTFAYFANGKCNQVDAQCRTFDSTNGACTACYQGYILSNGACNLDKSTPSDPLCFKWSGAVCQQCAAASYFVSGVCTASNPQCKTFDSNNGNCLSCYGGYVLQHGNCNVQVSKAPSGPSANFDIYCKKYRSGACTACFFGFELQNGRCVAAFDKANCAAP